MQALFAGGDQPLLYRERHLCPPTNINAKSAIRHLMTFQSMKDEPYVGLPAEVVPAGGLG